MNKKIKIARRWIIFFMISLAFSGITAIPVEKELHFIGSYFSTGNRTGFWLHKVLDGVRETNKQFPFIGYGYDWLAFAHIVLAILFIGPLKDPVKNKWVIQSGMIACLLVIPFAVIAGYYRGIPLGWRLIDCCFGVLGLMPLTIAHKLINQIENSLKNKIYDSQGYSFAK